MSYDVAISYARENEETAAELHAALCERGLDVFWDQDRTSKRELWGNPLDKQLTKVYRNARCCVVLLSPHYFQSEWTKHELHKANNALPVIVEQTRIMDKSLTKVVYTEWPDGGAVEFVEEILAKLELLDEEREARRQARKTKVFRGAIGVASTAAGVAATFAANRRTQQRLEENTGSVEGYWNDPLGASWQIAENGSEIELIGKAPNGVDVHAKGTRKGSSIRAEWESPAGRGTIAAKVAGGGDRIAGQFSSQSGVSRFLLSR